MTRILPLALTLALALALAQTLPLALALALALTLPLALAQDRLSATGVFGTVTATSGTVNIWCLGVVVGS